MFMSPLSTIELTDTSWLDSFKELLEIFRLESLFDYLFQEILLFLRLIVCLNHNLMYYKLIQCPLYREGITVLEGTRSNEYKSVLLLRPCQTRLEYVFKPPLKRSLSKEYKIKATCGDYFFVTSMLRTHLRFRSTLWYDTSIADKRRGIS
jgi:hypothetical protein